MPTNLEKVIEGLNEYGIFHYVANKDKGRIWLWFEDETDYHVVTCLLHDEWKDIEADFYQVMSDKWVLMVN